MQIDNPANQMLTIHTTLVCVVNPEALVPVIPLNSAASEVESKRLRGMWYRVFPVTSTDVFRLQALKHHVDKFTPADGKGMLVSPRAMRMLH